MTIGLTFRQLLIDFAESWDKRDKQLDVEILTAKEGLNPDIQQFSSLYRKMYPELTEKQTMSYVIFISALLDTIVRNNEALAKSIFPSK